MSTYESCEVCGTGVLVDRAFHVHGDCIGPLMRLALAAAAFDEAHSTPQHTNDLLRKTRWDLHEAVKAWRYAESRTEGDASKDEK
jgi:hypothetical protein